MRTDRVVQQLAALIAVAMITACRPDAPVGVNGADLQALAAKGTPGGPGGGGGEDGGYGNNLSYPVIFAEGRGLAGASVAGDGPTRYSNTGLRPTATDSAALAELERLDSLPFWYSGNTSEAFTTGNVFWQKTANVWQAQWLARSGDAKTPVIVDWGDNLRSVKYSTTSVVRVEHVMTANDSTTLLGYLMDVTVNASSPTEKQGIYDDGNQTSTSAFTPTVFSDRARLTIQKLSAKGGTVTYTYFDKAVHQSYGVDGPGGYAAEINVGGKLVYGYVLDFKKVVMPAGVAKDGWWRITFSLDAASGATFAGLSVGDAPFAMIDGNSSTAEIEIGTMRGGGGRKP